MPTSKLNQIQIENGELSAICVLHFEWLLSWLSMLKIDNFLRYTGSYIQSLKINCLNCKTDQTVRWQWATGSLGGNVGWN